jgi:hypothetical protein
MVSFLSPLCFSVYLIHMNINFGRPWFVQDNDIKRNLWTLGTNSIVKYLLIVICISVIIFFICCLFDCLRSFLFKVLKVKKISENIEKKIINGLKFMENKILL